MRWHCGCRQRPTHQAYYPSQNPHLAVLRDAGGHGVGPEAGSGRGAGGGGPALDDAGVILEPQLLQRLSALRVVQLRKGGGGRAGGRRWVSDCCMVLRYSFVSTQSATHPTPTHQIGSTEADQGAERDAAGLVQPSTLLGDLACDVRRRH